MLDAVESPEGDLYWCSGNDRSLVRASLALLQENEDLWRWALCLVHGEDVGRGMGNVISDMLVTGDYKIDCHNGVRPYWCQAANPNNMIADPFWGMIHVCTAATQTMTAIIGTWACGNAQERLLALLNFSAILFHEFVHLTWEDGDPVDSAGCRKSQARELTFLWALLTRFPAALSAGCIGDLAVTVDGVLVPDPALFLSSNRQMSLSTSGCCLDAGRSGGGKESDVPDDDRPERREELS